MSGPDLRAIPLAELAEASFPTVDAGFRIHIDEKAFDRATARGEQDLTREVGGVLVGRLQKDEGGPFLLVETTIDALHADERDTELTFTHETWAHIHETMDKEHQGRQILGWYHTHPGFGVFLSDRDKFIHKSFFNLPHQVALVYDPKSREHGVFIWREGEPVRGRRYWIGEHRHVFEPRAASTDEAKKVKVRDAAAEGGASGREPPIQDWLSTGVVAVVCLVLGGLLGWWLSPRSGGASQEERIKEIQKARMDGFQTAITQFNPQLVEILRRVLTTEGQARRAKALKGLEEGVAVLTGEEVGEEARQEALRKVEESQRALVELWAEEVSARNILGELGRNYTGIADARENAAVLSHQAAVLSQVCSDLAEDARKAGDIPRARRLLSWAMGVSPGRAENYRRKLEELENEEEPR